MAIHDDLHQSFGRYRKEDVLFLSNRFTMHQVLDYLVHESFPCEIKICSFSIGDQAARSLQRLKQDGSVEKMTVLLDRSCKANKRHHLMYLASFTDGIYLSANHSKIVLIRSPKSLITLVSSANLTDNPRWESFMLTSNPSAYHQLSKDFTSITNTAERYEYVHR